MNIKECISDLELQISWIEGNGAHKFPGYGNVVDAMREAIALLKDKEPAAPVRAEGADGETLWYCGACDKGVVGLILYTYGVHEMRDSYCPSCGRKVAWND